MGAHRGGRIGGIFDAGLHTLSAVGRLTEDTDEDEEERRKRIVEGEEMNESNIMYLATGGSEHTERV